jgi:hypothetical protein
VTDDVQAATSADREVAERWLQALVDLIAQLDLAFHGHDPQEAKRPIAARQLRYMFAMRAVGDLLKSAGRADLQHPFYELAEALHDHSKGRHHTFFDIDDSVRRGRGRGADRHDVWRLRANLCAGILWLEAAGQERDDAIKQTVQAHRRQLSKLERSGTKSLSKLERHDTPPPLKGAIHGWFKRFEQPTETDDSVAVGLFRAEKDEIEARRKLMSPAELTAVGLKRIEGVALRASKLLKLDRTRPRSKTE